MIGADTHKHSTRWRPSTTGTGRVRGSREIAAEDAGHLAALRWARELDDERVWAIEDCRHVSAAPGASADRRRRTRRAACAAPDGRLAPRRAPTRQVRRDRRAQAVARAVVKDGPDAFAAAYLDERRDGDPPALRSPHGCSSPSARAMQNRLRWQLALAVPRARGVGASRGRWTSSLQLDRIDRRLRRLPATAARVRVARDELAHIRRLTRQINTLESRAAAHLVKAHRPQLLAETGCGPMTAAILIGRTAGAERFRTDASFARHAGRRADPLLLRPNRPPPPQPRRRPPTQPRAAHRSRSPAPAMTPKPGPTSRANRPKARPNAKPSAASNATSHAAFTIILAAPGHPANTTADRRLGAPTPMPCLT